MQCFWGVRIFVLDAKHPFTLAPKMVAHIKEFHYTETIFVGYGEMSISSPSAYLGEAVINLKTQKPRRYYEWSIPENIPSQYKDTAVLLNVNKIFNNKGSYILILNEDKHTHWMIDALDSVAKKQGSSIKKMPEFTGAIVPSENFYLYKVDSCVVWK
jgi:hypothetical protein